MELLEMPTLNQKFVDNLPLDGSGKKYADGRARRLYLKQGKRHHSFFVTHEMPDTGKKTHYVHLGRSNEITLAEARVRCGEVWARLDRGLPPVEEAAERGRPWLEVVQRFIHHQTTRPKPRKPRTVDDYRRYLLEGPIPRDKDLRSITRADWGEYATSYKSQYVARQFLQNVSSCLSYAMSFGLVDDNPIPALIKAYDKPQARERVLNGAELRTLWLATKGGQGGDYACIIRLLALTGCRLREIAHLEKSEVDLDRAVISLPGSRTKNALARSVLLSPAAVAVLEGVEERGGDFVFGSAGSGFQGLSRAQSLLRDRMAELADDGVLARIEEFGNWSPHSLRRTMYTWLHDDGLVAEATISRIMGHSKKGLVKVYASDQERDAHETRLEAAARQAVSDWADYVMGVVK